MPVAVADFQVVLFAIVALEDVEFGDVEDDTLAVRGRDAPLAALALLGQRTHRERRRRKRRFIFLERPAAFCHQYKKNINFIHLSSFFFNWSPSLIPMTNE